MKKTDKSNGWVEEYFNLYKKGRLDNAPSGYVDYYKARHLMSKAIDKAVKEERMRFVEMIGEDEELRMVGLINPGIEMPYSSTIRNKLRQELKTKLTKGTNDKNR